MAKKNRGSRKVQTPAKQPIPGQVVINDFGINIQNVDTTRKNLNRWRQAYEAAKSILHPTRQELYALYTDIAMDDHLVSVTSQRRLSITNTSLVFQDDGSPIDEINEVIESECFDDVLEHALDSIFEGYSLIHADFRNNTSEIVPRAHVVPSKNLVVKNPYDFGGIDYTSGMYKNYYLGVGKPNNLGLYLIATPLVLIKRGDLSDWAQFNEIFGQPLRKGTYDPHMPGNKNQLLKALEESGAMAYIAVPVGSNVEFVEANKSGASETYDTLYDRMESGLSKLIVGQTMTTTDGSSLAQGQVHERLANKIAQSDRKFITRLLNGRIREMLIAQGYSQAAKGAFQFVDEEETISKKDRLTMDLSIHNGVGRLKKSYFAEEYNVEFVDDSDDSPDDDPESTEGNENNPPTSKEKKQEVKLSLNTPYDFFA